MAIEVEFTTPPDAPSSADATTFRTRADAFVTWMAALGLKLIQFVAQINATEQNINEKEASTNAAAVAALSAANFKGSFIAGVSSAVVGESWEWQGLVYRVLENTTQSPAESQFSWIAMNDAGAIHYDNQTSGLSATKVKAALDELSAEKANLSDLSLAIPAGTVCYFAQSTAPDGWIKANGALVSRTTYAALFAAIGTTFGAGDGSTTFKLPDLRGEFLRVWDDGRGVDSGRAFGSSQSGNIQSHSHNLGLYGNVPAVTSVAASSGSSLGAWATTTSSGGSETRPRNIAMLACIKY